jgi:GNAT superfamily N-acetyltransferase
MNVAIRAMSGGEIQRHAVALGRVLIDCVEGGASVSFMAPPTPDEAERFWRDVGRSVDDGAATLFVALRGDDPVGTTLLSYPKAPNQPHRADVAKVLVRRDCRRAGLATALMTAAERHARDAGRTLLLLDTETGSDAERFYRHLGWTEAGVVPDYFLRADGTPWPTTFYWKRV